MDKEKKTKKEGIIAESKTEIKEEFILEEENDTGVVRISENVINSIVRHYTLSVPGVIRFASSGIVTGLAEMIGKRGVDSSTRVDIRGEFVSVYVALVIEFGKSVPEIAEQIQTLISTKVKKMTGKEVSKVDVTIQDLEMPEESNEDSEEI
ncbi:MAG: Asp23/Gls24 family envelope stress response protein [Verrucomicrobiota bacterium]|nr:Asp23/Gls24 family envelope stress response protein [Verrucomicrobiota bacterium]